MASNSTFRILLFCLIGAGLLMVACAGVLVWRLLPTFGPLFAVAGEVANAYPGSNPNVTILYHNGQKTLRIAAAVAFDPDTDQGQQTAEGIAAVVREHYDLAGFSAIQVRLERRSRAGILQMKNGKTFSLPVREPPLTDAEVQQLLEIIDAAEVQPPEPETGTGSVH